MRDELALLIELDDALMYGVELAYLAGKGVWLDAEFYLC